MYSNIGGMIKAASTVFMWLGIIASAIAGTFLLIGAEIAYGIGIMIAGLLFRGSAICLCMASES